MAGRWNWEGGEAAGWKTSDLGEFVKITTKNKSLKNYVPEICGSEVAG
jgi:hypothetical protein